MIPVRSDADSRRALVPKVRRVFELSAAKIRHREDLESRRRLARLHRGRPLHQPRLDRVDAGLSVRLRDPAVRRHRRAEFLEIGRERTVEVMAPHVTHIGVHDHGFNNVSTYGNLLRLMNEGRIPENPWERRFYEIALKCSGAVQAARWSRTADGGGYIYSFNGPHSLFVDTIRSVRALVVSHQLGHVLMGENDRKIRCSTAPSSMRRATARYSVYYGEGRDAYDVRGRTAHESVFNVNDGNYRCPSSQQGYSPVHHLDARARVGHVRLRRTARISATRCRTGTSRQSMRARRPRARPAISTSRTRRRTAFRTGTRARRASRNWATGGASRPIRTIRTSRWTAPRPRSARRGCCGSGRRLKDERYWQAGLAVCRHAVRRAVPQHRLGAPGADPALASITGRTAGTGSPASRRCGAITMPASWRCTCCGKPRAAPI